MSTHEVYCSLDICKLLKEAGFDWLEDRKHCYWEDLNREGDSKSWFIDSLYIYQYNHPKFNGGNWVYYYRVPLHIAQKWLREVKNIFIEVTRYETIHPLARELFEVVYDKTVDKSFAYGVNVLDANNESIYDEDCFLTYEEAQEAGIKKALKLILEKGK